MVMVTGFESVRPACHESSASTTAVDVPQPIGLPPIDPDDASIVRPAGSDPDAIVQLTEPTAPVADGDSAYGSPTRPGGGAGITIANGGASTVTVNVAVALSDGCVGSNAATVNAPVCGAEATPETVARDGSNDNPAGSDELTSCHAHGARPPAHASVCL